MAKLFMLYLRYDFNLYSLNKLFYFKIISDKAFGYSSPPKIPCGKKWHHQHKKKVTCGFDQRLSMITFVQVADSNTQ